MEALKNTQKKPVVLAVDDERLVLSALRRLLKPYYNILTTDNGEEALNLLRKIHVDVIISDQRMPNMMGTELLAKAKTISPFSIRLLLTGYSDSDAIEGAINDAEIFRFISKPWKNQEVLDLLKKTTRIAQNNYQRHTTRQLPTKEEVEQVKAQSKCLILDDSQKVYPLVKQLVGKHITINHVSDTSKAIDYLAKTRCSVMVVALSKHYSDNELGLTKVLKKSLPTLMIIVIAKSSDSSQMINLINEGQIYRYITRPLRLASLKMYLLSAIRYHTILKKNPHLIRQHEVETIKHNEQRKFAERAYATLKKIFRF
ncbi:MAG: response regulator [Gammaproteobacteria bacterium]|nr:response regulator [Gammaproteobacteria bacterium]